MIYEFVDVENGARVEVSLPMSDAPPIDSLIEHEGRWLKRVASIPADVAVDNFTPFTSLQMPRNDPACRHHDAMGRPVFYTRDDVRHTEAATRDRDLHRYNY